MSEYEDLKKRIRWRIEEDHMDTECLFNEALDAIQALQAKAEELEKEKNEAAGYLVRNVLEPHGAKPLDDLIGICTQVDHVAATARNAAFEEAASLVDVMGQKAVQLSIDFAYKAEINVANRLNNAAKRIRSLKGE